MQNNIFVIGDLKIDHDVFVEEVSPESGHTEKTYKVLRRHDTAGGAANTARVLAVLNKGSTYLWGVIGRSPWGSFRTILENSNSFDDAQRVVELRGVHDESDSPMHTEMRFLLVPESGNEKDVTRAAHVSDIDHLHVPLRKRQISISYHLDRVHSKKNILSAIILNDFGNKALEEKLITKIGAFANKHRIPLFVDPHSVSPDERARYAGVKKITSLLPNLAEWCCLVGRADTSHWRNNLSSTEMLCEMAHLTLREIRNVECFVIKLDRDGAVLIVPGKALHYSNVHHVLPPKRTKNTRTDQIGSGDVMTAVFAAEYDAGNTLATFQKSNAAVASYWQMPWHRMPTREGITRKQARMPKAQSALSARVFNGMKYLPQHQTVQLSSVRTGVPEIFTGDVELKETVDNLIRDLTSFEQGQIKSVVLGAPAGTGKTKTICEVEKRCADTPIHCKVIRTLSDLRRNGAVGEILKNLPTGKSNLLIVVDEALKSKQPKLLSDWGLKLLDTGHTSSVRFFFVDAGFSSRQEEMFPEISRRATWYYYRGLHDRPKDIVYQMAGWLFIAMPQLQRVEIDGAVLFTIIQKTLDSPNPGTLAEQMKVLYKIPASDDILRIQKKDWRDWPEERSFEKVVPPMYTFVR